MPDKRAHVAMPLADADAAVAIQALTTMVDDVHTHIPVGARLHKDDPIVQENLEFFELPPAPKAPPSAKASAAAEKERKQ